MKCNHPKKWWVLTKQKAIKCVYCGRIIGAVQLNEFGIQTAQTQRARRQRKGFRVSPRQLD